MPILLITGDSASPSAVPGKILPDATIQTRVATDPDFQAQVEAAQSLLRERYPAIFDDPKPPALKIDIDADLIARHPDIDRQSIKHALANYIKTSRYLSAISRQGAVRVDLNMQPAGVVTPKQARIAQAELDARTVRRAARESAETITTTPPAPHESPESQPTTGRPILRLKKPAGTVVAAAIVARRALA